jgi:hypothetical protein
MMDNSEIEQFLRTCTILKPKDLIISDLKWKYLVRAVLRSKNVMIIGPSGCAKCLGPDTKIDVIVNNIIYKKIMKNRNSK